MPGILRLDCKDIVPISTLLPAVMPRGTYDIAKSWLQKCKRMCTKCNRRWPSAKLPSRLVYVGAAYDSRLQEAKLTRTEGLEMTNAPYLCLSYCWGSNCTRTGCVDHNCQPTSATGPSRSCGDELDFTRCNGNHRGSGLSISMN